MFLRKYSDNILKESVFVTQMSSDVVMWDCQCDGLSGLRQTAVS
jgi:hypothetical protein